MTDTTTPAAARYTGYELDALQTHEYKTEPFTSDELDIIDAYEESTIGVPDCFDLAENGDLCIPEDFTRADTLSMIQSYFQMLATWREDIENLQNALTAASDSRELGTAAGRKVGWELLAWARAREGYRAGVIEYFLGRDRFGCRIDPVQPPQDSVSSTA